MKNNWPKTDRQNTNLTITEKYCTLDQILIIPTKIKWHRAGPEEG